MKLLIKNINKSDILISEKYFGIEFCNNLKIEKPGTYNESLVSRYLIEKNKNIFSSISHKKDLVFIGTNNSKIGVDIEILKKRDENLLNKFNDEEYKILGNKNWKNFYILWTAKESIIKYENLFLDDMENIILEKKNTDFSIKNIYDLEFNIKLILKYKNKEYIVYSGIINDYIFSVVYDK